jgi:broad specificity phosphatase PhoE
MTLHFVRHGESTWNVAQRIQGQTLTPELTARGVDQAHEVAARLATVGVCRIVSSDALRAQQTAAIIGQRLGLPVSSTPLLRERDWGIYEGGPRDVARAVEAALPPDQPVEGGESRHDVRRRLLALLPELADESTVLVTHGGFIVEALAVLGFDEVDDVPNGSVTTIERPA